MCSPVMMLPQWPHTNQTAGVGHLVGFVGLSTKKGLHAVPVALSISGSCLPGYHWPWYSSSPM